MAELQVEVRDQEGHEGELREREGEGRDADAAQDRVLQHAQEGRRAIARNLAGGHCRRLERLARCEQHQAVGDAGDRWFDPGVLLVWLGIAAGGSFVALGLVAWLPDAGVASNEVGGTIRLAVVIAASMVCALTAMGWNGVFFAELARRAPPGELATVAGATQFITFFGSMAGPVVFGEFIRHGLSYSTTYLALAVLPVAAGVMMVRGRPEVLNRNSG